jgi:ribosomal protein S18 acetylase RimI-like enzyme
MVEIRVLTPDDWPIWRELRLAALAEAPYAFGSRLADWTGDGDREQRWRDRLALPGSYNTVALTGGAPAGMASGVPAGDRTAELISMWVCPAARGRGVGDRLIATVAGWAARSGYAELRLAVVPDNGYAQALYRRHGFTDTGEPGDLTADGVTREQVLAVPLTAP